MCNTAPKACNITKCVVPLVMGGLHSAVIMAAGDVMAQTFIENTELDVDKIDWRRTAKFGAIGLFYVGPVIGFWNGVMSRFIMRRSPPLEKVINRTVCTQIYLAPTLNFGIVALSSLLKKEEVSREHIEKGVNRDFLNIMEKNYMVWPITQLLSTTLGAAIKFAVLSTVSVFWAGYLSTVLMGDNSSKSPERKS